MHGHFEIGVVYKKSGRHYLAVTDKVLISFKNGDMQEVRPQARYDVVRSISVDELCSNWGINLDRLDEATSQYLAPPEENLKTRPRGSRRQRAADEEAWKSMRITRLVAG